MKTYRRKFLLSYLWIDKKEHTGYGNMEVMEADNKSKDFIDVDMAEKTILSANKMYSKIVVLNVSEVQNDNN